MFLYSHVCIYIYIYCVSWLKWDWWALLSVERRWKLKVNVSLLFSLSFSRQIFSMVVFGSIINEGYVNMGSERLHCVYNKNADACNYAITIGVVAFLACLLFLALDVYFPQISSVKDRKRAVLVEMGFSGWPLSSISTKCFYIGFYNTSVSWALTQ